MHEFGNEQDRYMRYLAHYLNNKDKIINQINGDKLQFASYLAPKIYERAHVLKERNPYRTELDCFCQAEREICDEKKVDYWVENEKTDYSKARKKLEKEHEIAKKAYELWVTDLFKKSEEYYWYTAQSILINSTDSWLYLKN